MQSEKTSKRKNNMKKQAVVNQVGLRQHRSDVKMWSEMEEPRAPIFAFFESRLTSAMV